MGSQKGPGTRYRGAAVVAEEEEEMGGLGQDRGAKFDEKGGSGCTSKCVTGAGLPQLVLAGRRSAPERRQAKPRQVWLGLRFQGPCPCTVCGSFATGCFNRDSHPPRQDFLQEAWRKWLVSGFRCDRLSGGSETSFIRPFRCQATPEPDPPK